MTTRTASSRVEAVSTTAWLILAVLLLFSIAAPLNQFKVPPIMPVLMANLGLSVSGAGLLMSVYTITGLILAIPSGFILQRTGFKITGLIAGGSIVIGCVLGALSNSSGQLLVSRVIEGAGTSFMAVLAPALIAQWFVASRRGTAMGVWSAWVPVGTAVTLIVAPPVAQAYGWRAVWWLGAVYAAAVTLLYLVVVRPAPLPSGAAAPQGAAATGVASRQVLRNRNIWLLATAFGAYCAAVIGSGTYMPTYLSTQRGIPLVQASLLAAIPTMITIFSAPAGGIISDRLGSRKKPYLFGLASAMVLLPLYGFADGWGPRPRACAVRPAIRSRPHRRLLRCRGGDGRRTAGRPGDGRHHGGAKRGHVARSPHLWYTRTVGGLAGRLRQPCRHRAGRFPCGHARPGALTGADRPLSTEDAWMPYTIDFEPVGRRGAVPEGTTLLDAARSLGVDLASVCGGAGTCGRCKVQVIAGEVSHAGGSSRRGLSQAEIDRGYVLACRAVPLSDVKLHVPAESLTALQRTQIEGLDVPVEVQPAVSQCSVRVDPPSLEDLRADDQRLADGVRSALKFEPALPDLAVVRLASTALREWGWEARVTLAGHDVIHVSRTDAPWLGLAVDIGTTKIAAYVVDLMTGHTLAKRGAMNPQIAYGEDVVARLMYASQGPVEAERMQELLANALSELAAAACVEIPGAAGGPASAEDIVEAVVVCNTAIHHLFLRLPVGQLAKAPYVPALRSAYSGRARDIGLRLAPGARVHLLPNIAGYVGADHVAMLLATEIAERADTAGATLAIDIGTNTEMCLAHKGKLASLSCASGPAFEGAHISSGMRAAPGAIERVRIEDGRLEYKTIDDQRPVGLCGSGLLDAVAQLRLAGMLDGRGRMLPGPHVSMSGEDAEFVLARADETGSGRAVAVTQHDIRELQLAKGAIRAGIDTLLADAGIAASDLERVIIAGAFGTYIDVESAITIGMLPNIPVDRVVQVGNAAGTGARLALISRRERRRAVGDRRPRPLHRTRPRRHALCAPSRKRCCSPRRSDGPDAQLRGSMRTRLALPRAGAPGWPDHPAWAYILVILATLFWAGNVTLGRALRFQAGPFTISAARIAIASLVFLFLVRGLPAAERRPGRDWPLLLLMALLGMVGCPVTLYLALRLTTASSTALINGAGPLITAVLAALFLHTRLTRSQLAGALLSLFGVLLVIGAGESRSLAGFSLNQGGLIMVVNVVMWGLYSILSRVVTRGRSAAGVTAFSTWFALPFLLVAAAIEWREAPPQVDASLVLALLYIGVFATCLAFLMWNEGVRRVGPDGAMAFYNMLPVFGVLLGALFLGEQMTAGQWLGGGLIIVGGLVAALWAHRPTATGNA